VNNELKQDFSTSELIHKIEDQIAYLSKHIALKEGDMILTGTGAGVSVIKPGDVVDCIMMQNDKEIMSLSTPVVSKH